MVVKTLTDNYCVGLWSHVAWTRFVLRTLVDRALIYFRFCAGDGERVVETRCCADRRVRKVLNLRPCLQGSQPWLTGPQPEVDTGRRGSYSRETIG